MHGELPTQAQLDEWTHEITNPHVRARERQVVHAGFRHDAHPMGMLLGSVGALSTFYPDALTSRTPRTLHLQTIPFSREDARSPPSPSASNGQPYVYPDNDLAYPGNFLNMLYKMTELKYEPDPRLERALDILFILHADHEQNCSTSAVRSVGSSQVGVRTPPSPPGWPRSTARCTRAPTRPSCGCSAGSRRRRKSPTSSPR